MAIKKTKYSGSSGRHSLHSPYVARVPAVEIIEHAFTEALTTADILELAIFPPNCRPLSAELLTVGTGAATFTVGFMSGAPFSTDAARTSGSELFSAVTPTTKQEASIAALAALDATGTPRSIGVKASADIAANAATKIYLRISYISGPK